jgi:hypothetical protein
VTTDDLTRLLAALADRDPTDPIALLAAALANPAATDLLTRAADLAVTLRDRQAVAIATAHVQGHADLVDALARDHLADHPDDALVRWIAAHSR